ncbi:MAG: type III toxin-antitoxin system ToxN/AbiQ family toxin [Clostridia bacterium]|nr:type III toxin-antitoxin system ToxN/AbiQ family toxin [Clostridia bacterium]
MKLYSITDNYINYLRKHEKRVYDNKEDIRKVTRKYLGIVLKVNDFNYYIPMSSPKKSDYNGNEIRKSIVPIVRMISREEIDGIPVLKGTLRISNMIPVPESELILYEPKFEKNKNYKILVEKELEFIDKNEDMIRKYARVIYNQKNNNYNVSYINNVIDFKLLEQKCLEYMHK